MPKNKFGVATLPSTLPAANVPSILSEGLAVEGDLVGVGDLQIDCLVEGTVRSDRLTLGPAGTIRGRLEGGTVIVYGRVEGEIVADEVVLTPSARVIGDVTYRTGLNIERGACFNGDVLQPGPGGELALVSDRSAEIARPDEDGDGEQTPLLLRNVVGG